MTKDNQHPRIPIVLGPTASGKTGVSLSLAQKWNDDTAFRKVFPSGIEIISADSRAIYKGFDIGTAKPTPDEQNIVRHWGLDIVEANQSFSVADFKSYTLSAIDDIFARGGLPVIVGGTGLYIDAIVFDYTFRGRFADETDRRTNLDKKFDRFLLIGIDTPRDILRERIKNRAESNIFTPGVFEEARRLSEEYGWDNEAMKGNIYPILRQYFAGEISLDKAKELFFFDDWHLARRQITWWKRNNFIKWLSLSQAEQELNKYFNELSQNLQNN
ncbi:tRNA (adenosine(37)-N6)-dimethylallyltransferase MiaA [Candidatus Saccharibacteria bacterium]|nr:tRNA (adenosine(37)-N6)-dimethylallyltransferase MiaA [Candidatus Saccharibacteria bacterium]